MISRHSWFCVLTNINDLRRKHLIMFVNFANSLTNKDEVYKISENKQICQFAFPGDFKP